MTDRNGTIASPARRADGEAPTADLEHAVRDRYAKAAATVELALCCPAIDYDPDALAHVPKEIIEVDYGCGDPSRHARLGETVLDLGSGSGKICRGPWRHVVDDDGHRLLRGQRMAVCDKTYRLLTNPTGPYAGQVIGIEPREAIPVEDAKPFDCAASALRHPRQTKGLDYDATLEVDACCTDGSCC